MPFEFADSTPAMGRKHRRGRGPSSSQNPSSSGSLTQGSKYASVTSTSLALPTPGSKCTGIEQDQNSCAGSLTYSASSSVVSAENSSNSSFAEIIKILDTEGVDGESKFKAYMSERPRDRQNACGMEAPPAVAGWMQRVEERSREQQKFKRLEQEKAASMINADMQYSNDDSSDDEMNMLGTIGGGTDDDDFAARDKKQPQESFVRRGPFRTTTPPPSTRQKRTSSPLSALPLVRTSSRHSKTSSDGSFGTPAPSSPPSYTKSYSKPPARAGSHSSKARAPVEDISEPVYKNFWMCGFADAFKFDGFKE